MSHFTEAERELHALELAADAMGDQVIGLLERFVGPRDRLRLISQAEECVQSIAAEIHGLRVVIDEANSAARPLRVAPDIDYRKVV